MSMASAIAESVVDKLEADPNVVSARTHRGQHGDPIVVASVYNDHCKRRVRRTLSEYPVYVKLEVN